MLSHVWKTGKPIRSLVSNLSCDSRATSLMSTEYGNRTHVQWSHDNDIILCNLHSSGAKKLLKVARPSFALEDLGTRIGHMYMYLHRGNHMHRALLPVPVCSHGGVERKAGKGVQSFITHSSVTMA